MSTGALFRAYLSPIASTRTFFFEKIENSLSVLTFYANGIDKLCACFGSVNIFTAAEYAP